MSYVKQAWADGPGGGTPLSAARMDHIEDGIEGVEGDSTQFPVKSGAWYAPQATLVGATNRSLATGTLFYVPLWVPRCAIDALAVKVTVVGAAGALIRLGLYADDGQGQPGALIEDAGTGDATILGVIQLALSAPRSVAGLVWLGAVGQVAASSTIIGFLSAMGGSVSASTADIALSNSLTTFYQASVGGALPANAASTLAVSGTGPRIVTRVS